MTGPATPEAVKTPPWRPPSAHFVNNVLAAAAGAIDEDPVLARDTLARLGSYLSARMSPDPAPVSLGDELDLVATYLALEDARFPDRLRVELAGDSAPAHTVRCGQVQQVVQAAVSDRLSRRPGACRVALRPSAGGLMLDLSDFPGGDEPERHRIILDAT